MLLSALFLSSPAHAQSTVADVVPDLLARADAAFQADHGEVPRLPSAARLEALLATPLRELEQRGCTVDFGADRVIGGSYGTSLSGSDQVGAIGATGFDRIEQTFDFTLAGGGARVGGEAFSVYDRMRLFAEQDDGGFLVGVLHRDRGTRGTFYALSATCPMGIPGQALDAWMRGSLCPDVCYEVCDLLDCDDGDACTDDTCDAEAGCTNSPTDVDDGQFCTIDTCDPASGPIHMPMPIDDGIACTVDVCNEALQTVEHIPVDAMCDDGNPGNGIEICSPILDCVAGPVP